MSKLNTKMGELELEKDGEKLTLALPPDCFMAETIRGFSAENWLSFLKVCKESGMEPNIIRTKANQNGNLIVLNSTNEESLKNMVDFFADIAGINKTPVKAKPDVNRIEVDPDTLKKLGDELGL